MKEVITSTGNPRIKNLLKLQQKSSERKEQNLIVIEGRREIRLAIEAGFLISTCFICYEIFTNSDASEELSIDPAAIVAVSPAIFEKIAYREGSDGIIAMAIPAYYTLNMLALPDNPLIVVLESIEKPGNLGAVMRTADAAGVDAVIVCDPMTDIYNPNTIRASIGCVFTVPLVCCSSEEALDWLRRSRIHVCAAALQYADDAYSQEYSHATALVMGSEASGLSSFWRINADVIIKIPMVGKIDSLNVSASVAVLVFEAIRQRRQHLA